MNKHQITIKDIARELKLSPSTVSRALRNMPEISKETREEVQAYAVKYKYQKNDLAMSLRMKKTRTIGVVIPEIIHYFFSAVLAGIEDVADKENFNVIVTQSKEEVLKEKKSVQTLLSSMVCGVLASMSKTTTDYGHFQELVDRNIPIVFFDRICPGILTDKVVVDDYSGAFSAVSHLIETGCRRIVFFGAEPRLVLANNRRMGYEDALRKNGLKVDKDLMFICDTLEKAEEITPSILAWEEKPDAFFAVNDETAVGILNTVKSSGFKVPEEISICGFTNANITSFTDPKLTTVDQHGFEVGATAMRLLIDRIMQNGEENVVSKIVKTNLIERGTTK